MAKTYNIEGMNCADCAPQLEKSIRQVAGVRQVEVTFMTGKMVIEGDPAQEEVRRQVQDAGYRLAEPVSASPEVVQGGALSGFFRFLLLRAETKLALGAGALILLAAGLSWAGIPETFSGILQITALCLAGFPIARSGVHTLLRNRDFNINLLMTLAAVGAILIGEMAEAATLIFLFAIAEALEDYTAVRARRVLGEVRDLAPTHAIRLTDKGEERVLVERLELGDILLVKAGERIPLDGEIMQGWSEVNQAPITGESLPVSKGPGDGVFAGTVNGSGTLEVRVTRLAPDTTLSRILHLIEEAQAARAPVQRFIDRFARIYTPAMVGVAVLVALLPPLLFGLPLLDTATQHGWVYRALSLLVIACPCALVISAPVTILSGITAAARRGVIIKGGAHLEALSQVKAIAFDKTGTLTRGRPVVTLTRAVDCATGDPCDRCDEVLALASALERRSAHPLAQAVVSAAGERGVAEAIPAAEQVITLNGRGVQGMVNGKLATVGSHPLFDAEHPHPEDFCLQVGRAEIAGQTTMLVCDGDGVRGFLAVADEPRPESAAVVAELHRMGIVTALLSGDNPPAARAVGERLGMDDVRGGLLPEEKVAAVRLLAETYGSAAMVGDGINDAPALAAASVGIAMGGAGSAQALESAAVVLMGDSLEKLPFTLRLARSVRSLIRQNIAFSLLTKLVFALLALAGITGMWVAVVGDSGIALLVTLNGMRAGRGL